MFNPSSIIDFLITFVTIFAKIYTFAILVKVILSWVPSGRTWLHDFVNSAVDPMFKLVKRFVPPIGFIDLSPIFVFILVDLAANLTVKLLISLKDLI